MTELYCRQCVLEKKILPCGLTRQELKDDKSLLDESNNCTNPNCGHHHAVHHSAKQAAPGEIELHKRSILCTFNCGTLSELCCARV